MIKVWHVATHTTNIGDGALVCGIHETISRDWGTPVHFIPDCLMEYENYMGAKRYDKGLIEKINSSADLLLIGGGGMMDGARGYINSGMGFDLPIELLKEIKIPVVYYAIGFNLFEKTNRQALKQAFVLNGAVYVASRTDLVRDNGFLGKETIGYIMPRERSIDIDTVEDWLYLDYLVGKVL